MTLVQQELKKCYIWSTAVKKIYKGSTKIRQAQYTWPELCFTANTAGSTVRLTRTGSPTAVTLETSTDGSTRTTYTIGNTITLSNVGDKVYWRNKSETQTGFSTSIYNYYKFVMSWSVAASWDIWYLLCKNSTTSLTDFCFIYLFKDDYYLTEAPKLPATTLALRCYYWLFENCSGLVSLPKLPALTLTTYCYGHLFYGCSKIKISTTQTWEYQTPYRIPTTWSGTTATSALTNMFTGTWWTFTWTPTINTTYYTSNAVI